MSRIIKTYIQDDTNNAAAAVPYTIKPKQQIGVGTLDESSFLNLTTEAKNEYCKQILEKAHNQAKKIMDKADAYSIKIIDDATKKAIAEYDNEVAQAREDGIRKGIAIGQEIGVKKGLEEGFKQGIKDGEDEIASVIKVMENVIEGMDDGYHRLLKKYEADLKSVAYAMAQKILQQEVAENPESLAGLIEGAASLCKNNSYLLISLSENSYRRFCENRIIAEKLKKYSDDVRFVMDVSLSDTDCIVETPTGWVDAGLDTQLSNLKTAINDIPSN